MSRECECCEAPLNGNPETLRVEVNGYTDFEMYLCQTCIDEVTEDNLLDAIRRAIHRDKPEKPCCRIEMEWNKVYMNGVRPMRGEVQP